MKERISTTVKDNKSVSTDKTTEKQDLQDLQDIFKTQSFPFGVFPAKLKETIEKLGTAFHVTPEVVACLMLPIISGAIGNTIRVSPREGWEEPPFIWLILIARTGYGKTPIENELMKPVLQMESQEESEYMTSDFTIEGLAEVFEKQPRGVIIHRDEFAGLILGLNQYKGKGNDRQHIIELWNAGSWKINRVSGPHRKSGNKFIPNTGASIVGGIQTERLSDVIKPDSFDDGLLPRFLFIKEDRTSRFSKEGINEDDLAYWNKLLKWCYGLQISKNDGGFVDPMKLTFSPEALDLFAGFHNYCDDKLNTLQAREAAFIPKFISYCIRITGILHLMKEFERGEDIREVIDVKTLEHAIELIKFFEGQTKNVLGLYNQKKAPTNEHNEGPIEQPLKRLIESLYKLKIEVTNGKLSYKKINRVYNEGLSEQLQITDNRQIGTMLRKLGLSTERVGGNHRLIWDPEKMGGLFNEIMSYKSCKSYSEDANSEENLRKEELELVEARRVKAKLLP